MPIKPHKTRPVTPRQSWPDNDGYPPLFGPTLYYRFIAYSLVHSPYLDLWKRKFCWSMQFVEDPTRKQLEKLYDIYRIHNECRAFDEREMDEGLLPAESRP